MHKKALSLDVNMKERFQTCLRTIFQAYMQTTYLLTGSQEKRYLKKKVKLFSNTQTCKHSNTFCVRERQKRSKNIMPEQDSLKTIIHVIKHLSLHALEITSKLAYIFSNLHVLR